jgi:citrate lyase subunit beta/citryl-CoA lyase
VDRAARVVKAPILTWLFVPADWPDRVEKAIESRAHAVIVDLEDGVPVGNKAHARANVVALLEAPREKAVFVRVNPRDDDDLAAVTALPLAGVVVPKVESPEDLPDLPVHAMIETARGVEAAFEIASHPSVRGIALGEADLRSQTGALEDGLDWTRGRIVNAAVAAGLPRPPQSVYMHVRDLDGLARSCRRGRQLGQLGRQAIHPAQLEVIEQAYLPTQAEVEAARATVDLLRDDAVGTVGDGTFVDPAMLGSAQMTLALADAYGVAE